MIRRCRRLIWWAHECYFVIIINEFSRKVNSSRSMSSTTKICHNYIIRNSSIWLVHLLSLWFYRNSIFSVHFFLNEKRPKSARDKRQTVIGVCLADLFHLLGQNVRIEVKKIFLSFLHSFISFCFSSSFFCCCFCSFLWIHVCVRFENLANDSQPVGECERT